jgi:hypothetical protein
VGKSALQVGEVDAGGFQISIRGDQNQLMIIVHTAILTAAAAHG